MPPKVFVSYSWGSPSHQALILEWANRLSTDGINVVMDVFDLKEGNDKYAFMERMISDSDVTHVLVFSDKNYATKADLRKSGVGTESQIISKEIYEQVNQSKFIPIICEFDDNGEPYLPIFLKSRIWIDFSSPQKVNENWEKLIRLLFGKPIHQKPAIGKAPAYIREDSNVPASPAASKFLSLQQAILQEKKGVRLYRRDFLDACMDFADSLRTRERPIEENLAQKVLDDFAKLTVARNHIVDWVMFESESNPWKDFSDALIETLERLREIKSRPADENQWNDSWFEAHGLFAYETFIYIVAALLKTASYDDLHNIFTSNYIVPSTESYGANRFETFDCFYASSRILNEVLSPPGQRLYSPAAELIKRNAQRTDISFKDLMQADLLILLMAFITPNVRWYPQLLHYAGYSQEFPFFARAVQHKGFKKLATITGIPDASSLRDAVKTGQKNLEIERWNFLSFGRSFNESLNLEAWDTIA